MSLFRRVLLINAGVLVAAAVLLAVSPATVSPSLQLAEAVALAIGTVLMITVNLVLLRRVFGPLEQFTKVVRRVHPHEPGRRVMLDKADGEVAELCRAFNAMLDRLEHERRTSGRRALAAQESERRRLARELHDEIGQTLTGVVLQLEGLQRMAPPRLHDAIVEAQESARAGVEDMREIARGLRPQALDDFGLRSALVSLCAQATDRSGVRIRTEIANDLPPLAEEAELALYRVAQESLTNVVRHAHATAAELRLGTDAGGVVELIVRDDGRGITPQQVANGSSGIAGMRERALLIGGDLDIGATTGSGTTVALRLPRAGS